MESFLESLLVPGIAVGSTNVLRIFEMFQESQELLCNVYSEFLKCSKNVRNCFAMCELFSVMAMSMDCILFSSFESKIAFSFSAFLAFQDLLH